jgi:hypothetical protein
MAQHEKVDQSALKELSEVKQSSVASIKAAQDAYGPGAVTADKAAKSGLDGLSHLDMPDIYKSTVGDSKFDKQHGWRDAVLTGAGDLAEEAKEADKHGALKGIDSQLSKLVDQEQTMAKDNGGHLNKKDLSELSSEEGKIQKEVGKDVNPHKTFTSPGA